MSFLREELQALFKYKINIKRKYASNRKVYLI